MLPDVHTVFSLRDYAVHVVGVNLCCSLVIRVMKVYQSYIAACLGAGLQHTPIVPFAPDRLQQNTVVTIHTTDLTFIVRPFSIRNISHFPHTRIIYAFRQILATN